MKDLFRSFVASLLEDGSRKTQKFSPIAQIDMVRLTWINNNIAISPAFDKADLIKIRQTGIDAIVDVRSEYQDDEALIRESGMEFFHVAVDDRYTPTQEQLESILDFVNPLLGQDKKILIHCQNGYGRSPLVAIAILVKRGMSVADAVRLLEDKHPAASFTPQQERFIYGLEQSYD